MYILPLNRVSWSINQSSYIDYRIKHIKISSLHITVLEILIFCSCITVNFLKLNNEQQIVKWRKKGSIPTYFGPSDETRSLDWFCFHILVQCESCCISKGVLIKVCLERQPDNVMKTITTKQIGQSIQMIIWIKWKFQWKAQISLTVCESRNMSSF